MFNIVPYPSSNFDDRPDGTIISTVVLHYTDLESTSVSLQRLCDPEYKVSAHYLLDEDGTIYQLVAEEKRAWHAGDSYWKSIPWVNNFSIGIEIQNPGYEYFSEHGKWYPYYDKQYKSLLMLLQDIRTRYPLIADNTVGHCDITSHREVPKIDPGPHFDWQYLEQHGFCGKKGPEINSYYS
jgi:N-acetylmuramoyl-L-alanine amidase